LKKLKRQDPSQQSKSRKSLICKFQDLDRISGEELVDLLDKVDKEWVQLKQEGEEEIWEYNFKVQNLLSKKKAQAQMKFPVIGMTGKILITSLSKQRL
jgi:arsenate reductase-like glutaredoxin family protein